MSDLFKTKAPGAVVNPPATTDTGTPGFFTNGSCGANGEIIGGVPETADWLNGLITQLCTVMDESGVPDIDPTDGTTTDNALTRAIYALSIAALKDAPPATNAQIAADGLFFKCLNNGSIVTVPSGGSGTDATTYYNAPTQTFNLNWMAVGESILVERYGASSVTAWSSTYPADTLIAGTSLEGIGSITSTVEIRRVSAGTGAGAFTVRGVEGSNRIDSLSPSGGRAIYVLNNNATVWRVDLLDGQGFQRLV